MKKLMEWIIQLRNPLFRFDEDLNTESLLQFAWIQLGSLLRGGRVLLRGRRSRMMLRGRGVKFFNLSRIRWGRFLKLGDHVYLNALGKQGILLGDNVGIGAFSRLVVSTSLNDIGNYIRIGNNVGMGEFAYLGGAGGLEIGDECIIGQYLSCHPENHIYDDPQVPIRRQGVTRKGIKIGRNCWIGSKVTVLDGVEIGDDCIVAAGAVVTRSMPAGSVIGGVPAKVIKARTDRSLATMAATIKETA